MNFLSCFQYVTGSFPHIDANLCSMMTTSSPNVAYPGGNNLGQYHGHPQTHLWRSAPVTGTAQYINEMEQATTTALHRRIAVLETQLAQAQADKMISDQTTRYLLRMASTSQDVHQPNVHSEELEAELYRSKANNIMLHDKLHKAVHSWGNNIQSQREASHNESVFEIQENNSYRQSHYMNRNIPIPDSKYSPVDLLDVNGLPDCVPELDFSGSGSSSTADYLDTFVPGLPPKIDLRLYNNTDKQHNQSLAPKLALEPASLSHLRMFTNDSHTSSAPECVNPLVNSNLAKLDPHNTSKLQTQTVSQGISGSLRTINGPSVGAAPRQPDTLSDILITKDSNTPCKSIVSAHPNITRNPHTSSHSDISRNPHTSSHSDTTRNPPTSTFNNKRQAFRYEPLTTFIEYNQVTDPLYSHRMEAVQYSPAEKQDMLHAVTITGLHPNTTKRDLLTNIHGGMVVSLNLVDTVSITGTLTALVKFLYERDTFAFYNFTKNNPLQFHDKRAFVSILGTASWPLEPSIKRKIIEEGHTRCLEVKVFPRTITQAAFRLDLRNKNAVTDQDIEEFCMHDGALELRFTSISAAGRAHELLTTSRRYNSCQVTFTADPCSLPVHVTGSKTQAPVSEVVLAERETLSTRPLSQDLITPSPDTSSNVTVPSQPKEQSTERKTDAADPAVTTVGLDKSRWAPTSPKPTSITFVPGKLPVKPAASLSTKSPRSSPRTSKDGKIFESVWKCGYCGGFNHLESHCYQNPNSKKYQGGKSGNGSPKEAGKGRGLESPRVNIKRSAPRSTAGEEPHPDPPVGPKIGILVDI